MDLPEHTNFQNAEAHSRTEPISYGPPADGTDAASSGVEDDSRSEDNDEACSRQLLQESEAAYARRLSELEDGATALEDRLPVVENQTRHAGNKDDGQLIKHSLSANPEIMTLAKDTFNTMKDFGADLKNYVTSLGQKLDKVHDDVADHLTEKVLIPFKAQVLDEITYSGDQRWAKKRTNARPESLEWHKLSRDGKVERLHTMIGDLDRTMEDAANKREHLSRVMQFLNYELHNGGR